MAVPYDDSQREGLQGMPDIQRDLEEKLYDMKQKKQRS